MNTQFVDFRANISYLKVKNRYTIADTKYSEEISSTRTSRCEARGGLKPARNCHPNMFCVQ